MSLSLSSRTLWRQLLKLHAQPHFIFQDAALKRLELLSLLSPSLPYRFRRSVCSLEGFQPRLV